MKQVITSFLLILVTYTVYAQSTPQQLYHDYSTAKNRADKGDILTAYFTSLYPLSVADKDTSLIETYAYFKDKGDVWGLGYIQLGMSYLFRVTGEYSTAIKYSLDALKNFESISDTGAIVNSLLQTGSAYALSQNYRQALYYYEECKTLFNFYDDPKLYAALLNNMADCYNRMEFPDSAMKFVQQAIEVAQRNRDTTTLGTCYSILGETWLAKGEHAIARPFLMKSLDYIGARSNGKFIANINCDMAASFYQTNNDDSVLNYASTAISYADPVFKNELMLAYQWMYKAYKRKGSDSANIFYELATAMKDSIYSMEKIRNIQEMHFQEKIREQEIAAVKAKAVQERKDNLQYALISLGIILFVSFFLLLSRSFITNAKLIRLLGIIALLLVFEFFNLLLHPFIENLTHHSPVFTFLALVCLAAILAPLHHTAEKWAINKLIEKNKEVRLKAAKKTIAELESEN
ncbi:MAG: tetratricopeptide repeat protein [Ferruginibacter sp.]